MSFTELRFNGHDVYPSDEQAFAPLRLLDESDLPVTGELYPVPPCASCFEPMAPVGASGWWCESCQEYQ